MRLNSRFARCPTCESIFLEDAKFCRKCGRKRGDEPLINPIHRLLRGPAIAGPPRCIALGGEGRSCDTAVDGETNAEAGGEANLRSPPSPMDLRSPMSQVSGCSNTDCSDDLEHKASQDPGDGQHLDEIQREVENLLPILEGYASRPVSADEIIDMCVRSACPALGYLKVALEAGKEPVPIDGLGPHPPGTTAALKEELHALAGCYGIVRDEFSPPESPEESVSFQSQSSNDESGNPDTEPSRPSSGCVTRHPSDAIEDAVMYDTVISGPSYPGLSNNSLGQAPRALMLSDTKPTVRTSSRVVKLKKEVPGAAPSEGPAVEVLSNSNTWFIHPEKPFRMGWDLCSLVLILVVAFLVPVELSFFWEVHMPLWLKVFSNCMDGFFLVDIVLNFFTAFHEGQGISGILVNDFGGIAGHYIRGWFFVDFLSTFPYEAVMSIIGFQLSGAESGSKASGLFKVLRFTKVVRIVKILRVLKLGGLMQALEEKLVAVQSMTVIFQLTKMTVVMLMMCHNIACAFFYLGEHVSDSDNNWLESEGLENHAGYEQYIAALYYAITTGTTVGYGDIVPTNMVEQLAASIGLVLAVSFVGQFISRACCIVNSLLLHQNELARSKRDALLFMIKRDVSRTLQFKVLRYIEHTAQTHAVTLLDKRIMGDLSESLQSELAVAITGNVFRQFPLFADVDHRFLTALCAVGTTKRAGVGDIVVWEDNAAREMFWVVFGEAAVSRRGQHINTLRRNDWFGELALFFAGAVRAATVRCDTHCEFLVLHRDNFLEQIQEFPVVKRKYRALAEQLRTGDPSGLKLVCACCGSPDHLTRDCPDR